MQNKLLLIILSGIVLTGLIHFYFYYEVEQQNEYELSRNAELIKTELEHTISTQIAAVSDLRAFMLASSVIPDFDSFDRFAQHSLEAHPTITSVAYVDPDRVIRHFYPLVGNEKAIGLDLMTRPAAPYVEKAIRDRIITVNHPTVTVLGKLTVIARAPMYQAGKLKGLVQGLLEIKTILNEIEYHLDNRIGYILRDFKDNQFSKIGNPIPPFKKVSIVIGDNQWFAETGWNNEKPGVDPVIITLIWVLGTLLTASASQLYYRKSTYTKHLSSDINDKTIELKRAYEGLSSKSEQYRSLVESSFAIPWEVDLSTFRFTYVGKQAETILGYPVDKWYEDGFWVSKIHIDDQDFAVSYCRAETSQGRNHKFEYRMHAADGNIVWLRDDVIIIKENGTPVRLQGFMFDITAQKTAEENLKHAYEGLEDKINERTINLIEAKEEAVIANNAKTHFLSRMSHELRTPMNAILGFAQLLDSEKGLDDKYKEYTGEILTAGKHLLELINEVLELSRIESGALVIQCEELKLKPVLDEISTLMQPIADEREITIHRECNIDESLVVVSEKTRLMEVLLNLFSNAIKYNEDQGTVTLKCAQLGSDKVRISVIDSGPGLDAEQQQQIFEPFNRLGAEYKGIVGSGIGLSITSHLLELMGSKLNLESTPGKGSCFYFDLDRIS